MKYLIAIFAVAALLLAGCAGPQVSTGSGKNASIVPSNNGTVLPNATVTLAELAASPEKYLNKTVVVDGWVRLNGSVFNGRFFLGNTRIEVTSWAPFSVSTCPPGVTDCKSPPTMSYYIGKKVRANGTFTEYGTLEDKHYLLKVDSATVIDIPLPD